MKVCPLCHPLGVCLSSGEVWSDEAQDCSFSRLLVSKAPGISCRVRDVAEVCVILDVGLQRGAGVNTASYIHGSISLSIKWGKHTPIGFKHVLLHAHSKLQYVLVSHIRRLKWGACTPILVQCFLNSEPFHSCLIILLQIITIWTISGQKIPHTYTHTSQT